MKLTLTLKHGIIILFGLITYFLFLRSFGLHTNPFYSLGNGFIMIAGIFRMYQSYSTITTNSNDIDYYTGYTMGFLTGMNSVLGFLLFFVFFCEEIEPEYLTNLIANWKTHYHTPDALVFFTVFVTGMATAIVSTLFFMQYYKRSWNLMSINK